MASKFGCNASFTSWLSITALGLLILSSCCFFVVCREDPPLILIHPPNISGRSVLEPVKAGDVFHYFAKAAAVELKCSATSGGSNDTLRYEWWKDERKIIVRLSDSSSYTSATPVLEVLLPGITITNTSLTIAAFDEIYHGEYKCRAFNAKGIATSQRAVLGTAVLADFAIAQDKLVLDITAAQGMPFSLTCPVPASTPAATVGWHHFTNEGIKSIPAETPADVAGTDAMPARVIQDPIQGSLHFLYASKAIDTVGFYRCSATNAALGVTKYGPLNRINVAGDFNTTMVARGLFASPNELLMMEGQQAELWCVFGGNPMPSITWTASTSQTGSVATKAKTLYGRQKLVIPDVTRGDEGFYTCTAVQAPTAPWLMGGGIAYTQKQKFYIRVGALPKWIDRPMRRKFLRLVGQSVSLPCKATGIPEPATKWYKNGAEMTPETRPSHLLLSPDGTLQFPALRLADQGTYECNSSNQHGFVSFPLSLSVLTPPMPAHDISQLELAENGALDLLLIAGDKGAASLHCGFPPRSSSAQRVYVEGLDISSRAYYWCAPGHVLVGGSPIVECRYDGSWFPTPPSCVPDYMGSMATGGISAGVGTNPMGGFGGGLMYNNYPAYLPFAAIAQQQQQQQQRNPFANLFGSVSTNPFGAAKVDQSVYWMDNTQGLIQSPEVIAALQKARGQIPEQVLTPSAPAPPGAIGMGPALPSWSQEYLISGLAFPGLASAGSTPGLHQSTFTAAQALQQNQLQQHLATLAGSASPSFGSSSTLFGSGYPDSLAGGSGGAATGTQLVIYPLAVQAKAPQTFLLTCALNLPATQQLNPGTSMMSANAQRLAWYHNTTFIGFATTTPPNTPSAAAASAFYPQFSQQQQQLQSSFGDVTDPTRYSIQTYATSSVYGRRLESVLIVRNTKPEDSGRYTCSVPYYSEFRSSLVTVEPDPAATTTTATPAPSAGVAPGSEVTSPPLPTLPPAALPTAPRVYNLPALPPATESAFEIGMLRAKCVRNDTDLRRYPRKRGCFASCDPSPTGTRNSCPNQDRDFCLCDFSCGWSCIPKFTWCPYDTDTLTLDKGHVTHTNPNLIAYNFTPAAVVSVPTVSGIARYSCDAGYSLSPPDMYTRYCQADGTWSGVTPKCLPPGPACGSPPLAPPNGVLLRVVPQANAQVAHYECAYGYKVNGYPRPNGSNGRGFTLTCSGPNSGWDLMMVSCSPITCPAFDATHSLSTLSDGLQIDVRNSISLNRGAMFGEVVTVYCPAGTQANPTTAVSVKCGENRQWSALPACVDSGVYCPVYPFIPNGFTVPDTSLHSRHRREGQVINIFCSYGAVRAADPRISDAVLQNGGGNVSRCLPTGLWSQPPPVCLGPCPVPGIPDGFVMWNQAQQQAAASSGATLRTQVPHGTYLETACHQGFFPDFQQHNMYPVCMNGTWSYQPSCVQIGTGNAALARDASATAALASSAAADARRRRGAFTPSISTRQIGIHKKY